MGLYFLCLVERKEDEGGEGGKEDGRRKRKKRRDGARSSKQDRPLIHSLNKFLLSFCTVLSSAVTCSNK